MRRGQRRGKEEKEEEADEKPLHHKKPFGAGLKRKRVEFVAEAGSSGQEALGPRMRTILAGDLYASVVLSSGTMETTEQESRSEAEEAKGATTTTTTTTTTTGTDAGLDMCAICSLPVRGSVRQHEASVAHQVSLEHSHPPSALDRSRMGLRTLAAQGWDPDARRGLGASGQGPRFPLQARQRADRLGIGMEAPAAAAAAAGREAAQTRTKPPASGSAPSRKTATGPEAEHEAAAAGGGGGRASRSQRTRAQAAERRRAERLQAELYGRLDVEAYLRRPMGPEDEGG